MRVKDPLSFFALCNFVSKQFKSRVSKPFDTKISTIFFQKVRQLIHKKLCALSSLKRARTKWEPAESSKVKIFKGHPQHSENGFPYQKKTQKLFKNVFEQYCSRIIFFFKEFKVFGRSIVLKNPKGVFYARNMFCCCRKRFD